MGVGSGGGGGGVVLGGSGECERKIEIFEKILKKIKIGGGLFWWGGGGVRVD